MSPKRLLSEAKQELENAAYENLHHKNEIESAKAEARSDGINFLNAQAADVDALLDEAASSAAVKCRDEFERLSFDAMGETVDPEEASQRLNQLDGLILGLEGLRTELARRIDALADIESDPIALDDDLRRRHPALGRHDFSF